MKKNSFCTHKYQTLGRSPIYGRTLPTQSNPQPRAAKATKHLTVRGHRNQTRGHAQPWKPNPWSRAAWQPNPWSCAAMGTKSMVTATPGEHIAFVLVILPCISYFKPLQQLCFCCTRRLLIYSLFLAYGLDQMGQSTKAIRSSISDMNCFSKILQFMAFHPFELALDALNQRNYVS